MDFEPEDHRHCGHIVPLPLSPRSRCARCGKAWSLVISNRRQCEATVPEMLPVIAAVVVTRVSFARRTMLFLGRGAPT